MRKLMLKYDEGLAQGHPRKEQAEVKPGISDSTSVACSIPGAASLCLWDLQQEGQGNGIAPWVVPLWVMKRSLPTGGSHGVERKETPEGKERLSSDPAFLLPLALLHPQTRKGAPCRSLIVHLSSFRLTGSHRLHWHVTLNSPQSVFLTEAYTKPQRSRDLTWCILQLSELF